MPTVNYVLQRALSMLDQRTIYCAGAGGTDPEARSPAQVLSRRTRIAAASVMVVIVGAGVAWWQLSGGAGPTPEPSPATKSERPVPAVSRVSLVGKWPASSCVLVIDKDDGNEVRGVCDTGIEHRFAGRYVTKDTVSITITRIDRKNLAR